MIRYKVEYWIGDYHGTVDVHLHSEPEDDDAVVARARRQILGGIKPPLGLHHASYAVTRVGSEPC